MPRLLALILPLVLTACASPGEHSPDFKRLDRALDGLEARGMVGQVLVADRNGLAYQRGMGSVTPSGTPVTTGHVFPLASVTKPFTAAAVLALAADGKLELDDPLDRHLPELSPPWSDIPLDALLTHTAGLPAEIVNRAWEGEPRFEPVDRETFLERVMEFPPDHEPGKGYNYSNVGYGLLGAVIETVSGTDWETHLHHRLLEPAGLEDIGFRLPDWVPAMVVVGRDGGRTVPRYRDQPTLDDGIGFKLRASGDLQAPATAMAAWWQAVREKRFLDPETTELWLEPVVEKPDGTYYGRGWHHRDSRWGPITGHTGGDWIHSVDFSWFRDLDLLVYIATAEARHEADLVRDDLHLALLGR